MTTSNPESIQIADNAVQTSSQPLTAATIQTWLTSYIAKLLDVSPQDVDIQMSFERYGLDSSAIVSLLGDLEHWLKLDLSPAILFDYPTIETLSQYLAKEVANS
jgi:acyl carrier protein